MEDKKKLAEFAIKFDKYTARAITAVTVLALAFLLSSMYDMLHYSARGINGVKYISLEELQQKNPDAVAWLEVENTNINHPVVQGKDNFEYLDKDFYGEYYSGGTLFLDAKNKRDFSDKYNIIHGHHMANGAMFSDLEKFMDEDFFEKNGKGTLETESGTYDINVFGVAEVDAYDLSVYDVKTRNFGKTKMTHKKDIEGDKVLVLSTCTGDLNNTRTVVFCYMEEKDG